MSTGHFTQHTVLSMFIVRLFPFTQTCQYFAVIVADNDGWERVRDKKIASGLQSAWVVVTEFMSKLSFTCHYR